MTHSPMRQPVSNGLNGHIHYDHIPHDCAVHHPLGAASYYFRSDLASYLAERCSKPETTVHVGCQPNNAPHLGNCTTIATAFAIAHALRKTGKKAYVSFVYVDTAPSNNSCITMDGVVYQRSLSDTMAFHKYSPAFETVLERLSKTSGVPFKTYTQDIWRNHPRFVSVLQNIIDKRHELGPQLAPGRKHLAIRAACPVPGCSLSDKHGIHNDYSQTGQISFMCCEHGRHVVNFNERDQIKRPGFNTPLRNFIRVTLCSNDDHLSWIMCTGADYAGFYQEQMLWRILSSPKAAPNFVYAPLVVDWAGGKLSKSMYVKEGAYGYLKQQGLGYVFDGEQFLHIPSAIEALYKEVSSWIEEPFKLFRNYSVEYMHRRLLERGMVLECGPEDVTKAKPSKIDSLHHTAREQSSLPC